MTKHNDLPVSVAAATGAVVATQIRATGKYILQEVFSNGALRSMQDEFGTFPEVKDAKQAFETAKKRMKQPPAEIGNWND